MREKKNHPWIYSKQNIMSKIPGPTINAEKFPKDINVQSAQSLFTDKNILLRIKESTEIDVKCVLQSDNLTVILDVLQTFFRILYALGIIGSKGINIYSLR